MLKLQLIGNIGETPTIHEIPNTDRFAIRFSVATTEKWKNKQNEETIKTTWVRCVRYSTTKRLAEVIKKGDQIYLEGTPNASAYIDNEGSAIANLELTISSITFLRNSKKTDMVSDNSRDDDDLPF
ncbi:single-stranded DNA-binding protein [Weeksella virosa]|uniref:single-stranded DNA-binding protein n=1 Tax=Weeksella virosa TaxID=1014 RepID=UPI0025525E94|nr:single-stranded DNA-binding protein [Weeksella virosa]MDK7375489.1 single-stranded DNA-binding protein [Weeksella virosa]